MPSTSRHLPADPAAVWSALVDLDRWPGWGPSVAGAVLDGGGRTLGPGATGRVRTAVGVTLPFTVTDWQPGRRWAWRVAGVPATWHEVAPAPGGGTVATIGVPWWAGPYLTVCWEGLRRLERVTS